MPMSSLFGALLGSTSLWSNPQMARQQAAIPLRVPEGAFVVGKDFVGWGCEARSLLFYAGFPGNPNELSQNLINQVGQRTGNAPIIRVGGTSLDHSFFDPQQEAAVDIPQDQGPVNVPFNVTYGPKYFRTFNNLNGVRYIVDLPLAYDDLDSTIARAKVAYNTIGADNILALEIGNEPDYYPGADRPQGYGPNEYVPEWTRYLNAISEALSTDKKFVAAGLARGPVPTQGWALFRLFEAGLGRMSDRIETYSGHYYQTQANPDSSLQRDLMNHRAIAGRIGRLRKPINYLQQRRPNIRYILGEVGSALNPVVDGHQTTNYPLEAVLGAALWQVDFLLYSAAVGVARVNMQLGIGFGYVPWQPTPWRGTPPAVRAPYYAEVFVADFIGPSGATQIANIDQDDARFSVYGAYEGGRLKRVAMVNFDLWVRGEDGDRPERTFRVPVPDGVESVQVKKLTSPEGGRAGGRDTTEGITWAGENWSTANNGIGQKVGPEGRRVQVENGHATVTIQASEAVMVFL